MGDYNLGTAKGTIKTEYDGKGVAAAERDLGNFKKSADSSKEGIDKLGRGTTIAGGAIAAGLGLAAKVSIDFEKQISAIGAVSGASQGQLETLRKKALQLGADTAFSASDAAAAMEELAKAGVPIEGILNGAADATVALAAAGGVELPAAAEIASDAMNSFSLSAQQMPHIADLIAGAANASSISVGDFGQSLKQVGAVANLVGLSFDDTATAIALMGQAGIKGSDAGTSLKTMLQNLQPTTQKQIALFKDLGLITKDNTNLFFDAHGNIKSLGEISQVLQDKTKNMTAAQKSLALETIFGTDAIRAAAVLTKAGSKGFEDMAGAMGKVTAEQVAQKRLGNTAGQIEQLKGSAETAAISLGSLLLPALLKITKALTGFFNAINNLSPAMKNAVVITALVLGGILGLLATIVKIYQFVKALKTVALAIKAVGIASKLAFLTNPIFLVIAAVAALVVGFIILWKRSEAFRNFWKGLWDGIKSIVMTVVNFIREHWKLFAAGLLVILGPIGIIAAAFLLFKDQIIGALKAVGSWFAGPFVDFFKGIGAWFAGPFLVPFHAVRDFFTGPFVDAFKSIGKWFSGPFVGFFVNTWNAIKNAVMTALNFVLTLIRNVTNSIRNTVTSFLNLQKQGWTNIWNAIQRLVTMVMNGIRAVITSVLNGIRAVINAFINGARTAFNGLAVLVGRVTGWFNSIRSAISTRISDALGVIRGLPGRILSALGNLGSLLYNKGREVISGLINGIKSKLGDVGGAMGSIVGKISGFLPGSPAEEGPLSGKGYVKLRGQRMMEDLATGIVLTANKARSAVSALMKDVSNVIPANPAANAATLAVARTPAVAAAGTVSNTRTVTISNLTITGTWDLSNPAVPRQFVAKLHEALDAYEKEHR